MKSKRIDLYLLILVLNLVFAFSCENTTKTNNSYEAYLCRKIDSGLNRGDIDSCYLWLDTLTKVAFENRNDYYISKAYRIEGMLALGEDSLKVVEAIGKSNEISLRQKSYIDVAKNFNTLSILMNYHYNYPQSLDYLLTGREWLNKVRVKDRGAEYDKVEFDLTSNIGTIYYNILAHDSARIYYTEALRQAKRLQNPDKLHAAYAAMGAFMGDALRDMHSSRRYYDSARFVAASSGRDYLQNPMQLNNYADAFYHLKEWDSLRSWNGKALELAEALEDSAALMMCWYHRALLHKHDGELPEARKLMTDAVLLARDYGDALFEQIFAYELAAMWEEGGELKTAMYWLRRCDSILDKSVVKQNTETLDNAHAWLSERNAKKQAEQRLRIRQAQAGAAVLALMALLAAATAWFFRQRQRQQRIIMAQQDQLHRQAINELSQRHTEQLTDTLLESQEETRLRIAQELHDGVQSDLAGIHLQFEILGRQLGALPEKALSTFNTLREALQAVQQEVRDIAHQMAGARVLREGLPGALADWQRFLREQSQLDVQYRAEGLEGLALPFTTELQVYRILQGLVQNVLAHARASRVEIEVKVQQGLLLLRVADNGQGFDFQPHMMEKHNGLRSIRLRAERVGGSFELHSRPGAGAEAKVEIPLKA